MAELATQGHAEAQLAAAKPTFQPGTSVTAALLLHYEPGWHGYWINPGETGMKTEISWQLPDGWIAEEPQFPVPHRRQDQLVSYGYEGEIWIPVTIHVPANESATEVTLRAQLKWLACDEKSCVPGKADVTVVLQKSTPAQDHEMSAHAAAIAKAVEASAVLRSDLMWQWREQDGKIVIEIHGAADQPWQDAELFPATENWLSPLQQLCLQRDDKGWRAVVDRSEYFDQRPTATELWIVPRQGRAVRLRQ